MYASVRQYEGVENPDEVIRQVKESFVPMIKGLPGFVGYYFVDVGDAGGRMVSVTLFDSQASAAACNQRAAQWVSERPVLIPPSTLAEDGPVVVQG